MLAILDIAQTRKYSALRHLSLWLKKDDRILVSSGRILGAPVLNITLEIEQNISPRALEKRLKLLLRSISYEGARQVCFADGFPYAEYLVDAGLVEQDLTGLNEIMARHVAGMLPNAGGTAFLYAPRLNEAGTKTLLALCGKYRYVLADIGSGGEQQFREIQRKLGVSVVYKPQPKRVLDAGTAVFMGTRREETELSQDCTVFAVNCAALEGVSYGRIVNGMDIALPADKEKELPKRIPREPLIARALENMTLSQGELSLRGITVTRKL